jgi:hypothetical protein
MIDKPQHIQIHVLNIFKLYNIFAPVLIARDVHHKRDRAKPGVDLQMLKHFQTRARAQMVNNDPVSNSGQLHFNFVHSYSPLLTPRSAIKSAIRIYIPFLACLK